MAGSRYPNYFSDGRNDSGFNSPKYILYFPYLKAKGLFFCTKYEMSIMEQKQELHGNVYTQKSRSTVGVIIQTRHPDLVVSAFGLAILLPSVFPVCRLARVYAVFVCFRLLPIFRQ